MAIIVDNFSGTPLEGRGLRIELDYTGGPGDQPTFIGWAPPGKLPADAVWKICKLEYTGTNLIRRTWADGDTKFDNVWNDRASLSYS